MRACQRDTRKAKRVLEIMIMPRDYHLWNGQPGGRCANYVFDTRRARVRIHGEATESFVRAETRDTKRIKGRNSHEEITRIRAFIYYYGSAEWRESRISHGRETLCGGRAHEDRKKKLARRSNNNESFRAAFTEEGRSSYARVLFPR